MLQIHTSVDYVHVPPSHLAIFEFKLSSNHSKAAIKSPVTPGTNPKGLNDFLLCAPMQPEVKVMSEPAE